jgi:hypothetical protein
MIDFFILEGANWYDFYYDNLELLIQHALDNPEYKWKYRKNILFLFESLKDVSKYVFTYFDLPENSDKSSLHYDFISVISSCEYYLFNEMIIREICSFI